MIIFSSNLCFKSHYTSLSQGPNALTIVIWELHKLKNKENLIKEIYLNDLNFIQHKIVISQSDFSINTDAMARGSMVGFYQGTC